MGQEFTINSKSLETQFNALLPSQGGFGAGVDLSASTLIIPTIDLTSIAKGGSLREDLSTSLSLTSITNHFVENATVTLINNTGYFRLMGFLSMSGSGNIQFNMTDGTTTKNITKFFGNTSNTYVPIDFTVFLTAGDSLTAFSAAAGAIFSGVSRQVADLDGNVVNPV